MNTNTYTIAEKLKLPTCRFKIGMDKPYGWEGRTRQFHVGFTTVAIVDCKDFYVVFWCELQALSREEIAAGWQRMSWEEAERIEIAAATRPRLRFKHRWVAGLYGLVTSPIYHGLTNVMNWLR